MEPQAASSERAEDVDEDVIKRLDDGDDGGEIVGDRKGVRDLGWRTREVWEMQVGEMGVGMGRLVERETVREEREALRRSILGQVMMVGCLMVERSWSIPSSAR